MKNLGKITILFIILIIFSFILLLFKEQALLLDENLLLAVNGLSNPLLDTFFIVITRFGSIVFWIIIVIIAWLKKEKKLSIYLIYALVIDSLLSISLKWAFMRSRPSADLLKKSVVVQREIGPSFPSAHTQRAFSGAVLLSSFYKVLKFETAFYFIAFLVGLSRIYLGAHYPIDTLFGSLIGIISGNIILNLPTKKAQEKIEGIIKRIKGKLHLKK